MPGPVPPAASSPSTQLPDGALSQCTAFDIHLASGLLAVASPEHIAVFAPHLSSASASDSTAPTPSATSPPALNAAAPAPALPSVGFGPRASRTGSGGGSGGSRGGAALVPGWRLVLCWEHNGRPPSLLKWCVEEDQEKDDGTPVGHDGDIAGEQAVVLGRRKFATADLHLLSLDDGGAVQTYSFQHHSMTPLAPESAGGKAIHIQRLPLTKPPSTTGSAAVAATATAACWLSGRLLAVAVDHDHSIQIWRLPIASKPDAGTTQDIEPNAAPVAGHSGASLVPELLQVFRTGGHYDTVLSLSSTKGGDVCRLLSGGRDQSVRLWPLDLSILSAMPVHPPSPITTPQPPQTQGPLTEADAEVVTALAVAPADVIQAPSLSLSGADVAGDVADLVVKAPQAPECAKVALSRVAVGGGPMISAGEIAAVEQTTAGMDVASGGSNSSLQIGRAVAGDSGAGPTSVSAPQLSMIREPAANPLTVPASALPAASNLPVPSLPSPPPPPTATPPPSSDLITGIPGGRRRGKGKQPVLLGSKPVFPKVRHRPPICATLCVDRSRSIWDMGSGILVAVWGKKIVSGCTLTEPSPES